MARRIDSSMTLDDMEDEIIYTVAALEADPDASDLTSMTADWLDQLDTVRTADRSLRQSIRSADANRQVANQRLDMECISLSRDILYEVDNNREDPRFQQFFKERPSKLIIQPLGDQVDTVKGWLTSSTDAVLEARREALTLWSNSADTALISTQACSMLRSQQWQRRHDLAAWLTDSRDGLHRKLAERAQERSLSREWPDVFFIKTANPSKASSSSEDSNASTTGSTGSSTSASRSIGNASAKSSGEAPSNGVPASP